MNGIWLMLALVAITPAELDQIDLLEVAETYDVDTCWEGAVEVSIVSTYDATLQPAMWYDPEIPGPVPLLVSLHTWGGSYCAINPGCAALAEAKERGWALMNPHYRGSNYKPAGCASPEACQDVLDAVAWARRQRVIDDTRVYLFGGSGGGHMALVMGGKAPTTWAAISAWVPPTDLEAWYWDTKNSGRVHWQTLEWVCGGPPEPPWLAEYIVRSSLPYVPDIVCPVEVCTGVLDGLHGSVPPHHTLWAWNILAEQRASEKVFNATEIVTISDDHVIPPGIYTEPLEESRYYTTLVHRTAGDCRVIVSTSAHGTSVHDACNWLEGQAKQLAAVGDSWSSYR